MGEFDNSSNMEGEENAAFWLPSHFLTDDDFLSPPPKPKEENDDEFFAELTRQLARSSLHDNPSSEKGWKFSTSPQSTLSGFGQWSNGPSPQVPSPPLTPPTKNDDAAAWDLLYEAAGQVARLKLAAAQLNHHQHHHNHNRGLLSSPAPQTTHHHHNHNHNHNNHDIYHQYEQVKRQQQQQHQMRERGALGLPQSAWPTLRGNGNVQESHCRNPHHQHHHGRTHHRHHHHPQRQPAVFLGTKRQSTGTGVFIPRKIGGSQSPPEPPRKKPTGCSTVLLPTRVIQTLNMDMEEMNSGVNRNSHSSYLSECELLVARRNAILAQQRRSTVGGQGHIHGHGHGRNQQELCLPNDWTY